MFVCPPIVPFSNTSLPYSSVTAPYVFICYYVFYILSPLCLYVILSSVPLLPCLLHTLSIMSFCLPFLCYHVFTYSVPYVFMSFCLPFLCYHVFYILCPLCLYVFRSSVTMSFTYSVPYVFMSFWLINVKYFHHLPILSVNCEWRVGQYLPFLSRTFREEFITIKNTIVYKIKQRRRKSENHKFIYGRNVGKEVKERKILYKNKGFVYIFHNKVIFLPYTSHLTS